jgi:release factor glutamine methyltransferase
LKPSPSFLPMANSEEPWTVGRLLSWTIDYLTKQGADNPRLDAEVLLAHARGCRRIDLYTSFGDAANDETRASFRELVKRRAAGEPVAYLVGHREFYSLDFEVTPDVLIPRPETESLVVSLMDAVKQRDGEAPVEIADVGTGSGIIAVSAAKYLPNVRVKAIDISPAALAVARRNAERHGVADRIEFVEANLLSTEPETPRFDVIASNPPYVATSEMEQLAIDVREYEPDLALRAGENGTDVIAPLIEQSAVRLKPGGGLLIEISPMIAQAVEGLIAAQPALELGPTIKDLAGHARVVQAVRRN